MTQQYQQRNINNPEGGRTITNSVATPNAALTAADVGKVIRFDTTLAVGALTLPTAAEAGDGAEITIIKVIDNANALTIAAAAGDTALGVTVGGVNAAQTIVNSSWVVVSDGTLAWTVVGGQIQAP